VTRRLVILPQANVELHDQAEYISIGNEDMARRFFAAAETTFRDLIAMPGIGRRSQFRNARLRVLRSWRIRGFENWLIFYRVTEEAVEVVRVLHGARDLEALFEADEGAP